MESLIDFIDEENEETVHQESLIDTNTNASGKVRHVTKRTVNKSKEGWVEAERKEEGSEREENVEKDHGELDNGSSTTASGPSEAPSNTKPKETPSSTKPKETPRRSGSQDGAATSDMRRVKNINMGEIPLCPVGLSLSGSGMQLYVKMDKFLHKKQLACLENQFISKIYKARAAGRMVGRARKTSNRSVSVTNERNRRSTQPGDTCQDTATRDHIVEPSTPSDIIQIPVIDPTSSGSIDESQVDPHCGCDVLIKEEVFCDESEEEELEVEDDCTSHQPQRKNSIVKPTPISNIYSAGRDPHKGYKKSVLKSVNCKRGSKRNQGIQTTLNLDETLENPKSLIQVGMSSQKRSMPPPVFTSSDLPLKRPSLARSCSSEDILIHQQRNNSSFFSPVHPQRVTRADTNNASASAPPEPNFEAYMSSRKCIYAKKDNDSTEKMNRSESLKYALIETDGPEPLPQSKLRDAPHTSATDGPHASHRRQTHNPDFEERMVESANSLPCEDFDPSQALESGVVDAETLAKFAEYTKSMRRDLRQNYKRLSGLMKDFNEQVMEHSRTPTDMTNGNVIDGDPEDETLNGDSRSRCLLM